MKKMFWVLGLLLFVSANGQTFTQKIQQVHEQANTDFKKAYKLLNTIKTSKLNNNQKATVYWYKAIISNKADSVLHYASQYTLPNISSKNKSLLFASLGNFLLEFYWQPQKAKKYIYKAFRLYKMQINEYSSFEAQYIINQYGTLLFALGNFNDAAITINKHYQNILEMPCGNWAYRYINDLVLLNVISNRPDIGMACSTKMAHCNPVVSPLLSSLYNNLGQLNIYNGNYYQAIYFQEKAKNNYDALRQSYDYEWYWHMGWLNSDLGNYKLADSYLQQAEKMIVVLDGNDSYDYFLINLEKLKNNLREEDTLSASKIISILEKIEKKSGIENDIAIDFLDLKGYYCALKQNYSKAIAIYREALEKRKKVAGNRNFLILSTYKKLIKSLLENRQQKQALQYIKEAEKIIQKYFQHSTTHDILQIYLLKNAISQNSTHEKIEEYKVLVEKSPYNFEWKKESYYQLAQLYYVEANKVPSNKKWLEKAAVAIDSSYHYEQKLQLFQSRNIDTWESTSDLEKIRTLGIKIALKLYHQNPSDTTKEKLFYYSDYTKYSYFKEHLLLLNQNFKKIPFNQGAIQQEKQVRAAISSYYYGLEKGENSIVLKKELNALNRRHEKILQQLSKEAKAYYDYFVDMPAIGYQELQEQLKPNEVFVSYTVLDNQLVILLISSNYFKVFQSSFQLQPFLDNYFKGMQEANVELYKKNAFQLYKILLQPILSEVKGKVLLTSLDAQLSGINLETLISSTQGNNFKELSYALYKIQPQYVVTGTSYILSNMTEVKKGNNVTFIAPDFSKLNSKYISQPFVQNWKSDFEKEVNNIIINPVNSKKQELLTAFQLNPTTILGTHTQIENTNPLESKIIMDVMNDEKNIKLSEIFSLQDTSDLVVLASCSTAKGEYNEGLGLMSIANGFFYSGSKSIICTLWEVDEQSTVTILKNWWNTTTNKTNNQKLQQSKINMIKNSHPKLANPFYWGGIILYGKDLQKTSNINNYIGLLIPILLIIVFYFLKDKPFKTW